MKFIVLITAIFFGLCMPLHAQINLNGIVMNDDCVKNTANKGCKLFNHVRVSIGTLSCVTDINGKFFIKLPEDYTGGSEVISNVEAPGYVIFYPLYGKFNLPNDIWDAGFVQQIILVPRGSFKLLSSSKLSEIIDDFSIYESKSINQGEEQDKVNYETYFKSVAAYLGLSEKRIRDSIDVWKHPVSTDDLERKASKARARGEYKLAGLYQQKMGEIDLANAKRKVFIEIGARQTARLKFLSTYKHFVLAGTNFVKSGDFSMAIQNYNSANNSISLPDSLQKIYGPFTDKKMQVRMLSGVALWGLSINAKSDSGNIFLSQSVNAFQDALNFYTKEQSPRNWASIQVNLAIVYKAQAARVKGKEIGELFSKSMASYSGALDIYTQEGDPQNWATVQNNLGVLLATQGVRSNRQQANTLIAKAVDAYRKALKVRTKNKLPRDWAATQNNLGIALKAQSERETDDKKAIVLLNEAISAYQSALEVRTRKMMPQQWASTQNNLVGALERLAQYFTGDTAIRLLTQSLKSLRSALTERPKNVMPQDWAATQNNIANVLGDLGVLTPGEKGMSLLRESINSYQTSLEVYTKESVPQQWANTQTNLAIVFRDLAARTASEKRQLLLESSLEAFNDALTVRTKETLLQDWATTQFNLALLYDLMNKQESALKILESIRDLSPDEVDAKINEIKNRNIK